MKVLKAAIVIPVYKKIVDDAEERSLQQCLKVLKNHPVFFACARSLDTAYYRELCEKSNHNSFSFITFDDYYFQSIPGYCRLLLIDRFYRAFKQYDYMLLYQPDAWVFRDELMEWCNKGFDYVGAPWFIGQDKSTPESGFMEYSGNGGFSLRKISSFRKVIHTYKIIKPPAEIWKEYASMGFLKRLIRLPLIVMRMLGWKNNSIYARNIYPLNEDNYWAVLAHKVRPAFKAAKAEEAISFAFEHHPAKMLELNHNRLPFGCHAWLKLDYDFWKPYLISSE
ncbi:MAG TPA: DUF5672 family protein [Chitinophagales bacterium]|nr:DUF5672 family protein [Chitinophagales bacterium]